MSNSITENIKQNNNSKVKVLTRDKIKNQNPRYFNDTNPKGVKCYQCNKFGHSSNECVTRNMTICFICGANHDGKCCKYSFCKKCNNTGHNREDCRKTFFNDKYCILCCTKKHYYDECSEKYYDNSYIRSLRCFNCNNIGHLACGIIDKSEINKVFYCCNCGSSDHYDLDCEKKTMEKDDILQGMNTSKFDYCLFCSERGHKSRFCPKNKDDECTELLKIPNPNEVRASNSPHKESYTPQNNILNRFSDISLSPQNNNMKYNQVHTYSSSPNYIPVMRSVNHTNRVQRLVPVSYNVFHPISDTNVNYTGYPSPNNYQPYFMGNVPQRIPYQNYNNPSIVGNYNYPMYTSQSQYYPIQNNNNYNHNHNHNQKISRRRRAQGNNKYQYSYKNGNRKSN